VPDTAGIVIVHDAARPLASADLFAAVVAAVREGADAAIPCLPVADTLKRVRDGLVVETVDRTELHAVQTPQAFRREVLRRAHEGCPEATDDAALVEAIGGVVVAVPGEARNRKITDPSDLALVGEMLGGGQLRGRDE
jgi:2-C-methyl-D-erythritol 4-phosphate cytidylyltransferase